MKSMKLDPVAAIAEANEYRHLSNQYQALLKEYRQRFGLSAAMAINNRLTDGAWYNVPFPQRVGQLMDRMQHELAQEDLK